MAYVNSNQQNLPSGSAKRRAKTCNDSWCGGDTRGVWSGATRDAGLQPMTRRRGNPNWGKPIQVAPAVATEFELRVMQLQLTPEMYTSSTRLRTWCGQNRNRCYVPEWLLAEWCITVDTYFSGAAWKRPVSLGGGASRSRPPRSPSRNRHCTHRLRAAQLSTSVNAWFRHLSQ